MRHDAIGGWMDGPLGNCHSQNCSMTRENKRCKKDWFSPSPPPQALQIPSHLSETASSSLSLFVVVLFCFVFLKKKSSAFEGVHQFLRCTWFHSTKELQLSPSDLLTGALEKGLAHSIPRATGGRYVLLVAFPCIPLPGEVPLLQRCLGPAAAALCKRKHEAALFSSFGDSHWSWSPFQECNCFIII